MAPIKILLAEDDLDDREFFFDFLVHRKDIYIMPVAENGNAVIHSLENISNDSSLPDLIVLDQNMPVRNGLQTLCILKQHERYTNIPVIIYSTITDEKLRNACSAMGASGVFVKPATKEGYDLMINDFLKIITCS